MAIINNVINANVTSPLPVTDGGTGANALTIHGLLKGDAAGAVSALPAATNGQLPIGSTGSDPVLNTLIAGVGISITNGAGTITLGSLVSQGIVTLDGDSGAAIGTTVTLAGGNNITTAASGSTVTFNVSGTTNHALQVGNSTGSLTSLGVATNGQLAIGSTGADPVLAGLTAGTGISVSNGAGSITIGSLVSQGIVTLNGDSGNATGTMVTLAGGNSITTSASGSTVTIGVSGTTTHALQIGDAGHGLTSLGVATNGQIPIGSTSANPVLATLTAGTNITITNGAGSITIDASGGGGGGITTIDGDTGSATGSTVTFTGLTAGSSVEFQASGAGVSLIVEDSNANTLVGNFSGNNTGTGGQNVGFGHGTLLSFTTATANTAVGYNALLNNIDAGLNVALGNGALQGLTTGSGNNTALGTGTLLSLGSGTNNIAIGNNAGSSYGSTESNNITIGSVGIPGNTGAIYLGDFSTQTTCFVAGTANVTPGGTLQVVVIDTATGQLGSAATPPIGDTVLTNTIVGVTSGNGSITGTNNTSLGQGNFVSLTSGSDNTAMGVNALFAVTDSPNNTALGDGALAALVTGSGYNTAVGISALTSLGSGDNNIGIGFNAGGSYTTTETSNIVIGNIGVIAENNTIRIGTEGTSTGQQSTCFIAGIANATVTGSAVLVDVTTGQLGLAVSSKRFKTNITDMGDRSSGVMNLRPVNFSYKEDITKSMQFGLIAEEVAEIMPHIVTYDAAGNPHTVRYHELPSILLNEMKKLLKRVEVLEERCARSLKE